MMAQMTAMAVNMRACRRAERAWRMRSAWSGANSSGMVPGLGTNAVAPGDAVPDGAASVCVSPGVDGVSGRLTLLASC